MTAVFDALRTTPSAFGNEKHVIASQCAHWRGNPLDIPETFGDRHTT